jgi:hypothetical protein
VERQWEHEIISDPDNNYIRHSQFTLNNIDFASKKPSPFVVNYSSDLTRSPKGSPGNNSGDKMSSGVVDDLDFIVSLNSYADFSHIPDLYTSYGKKPGIQMVMCHCTESTDIFNFYVSNASNNLKDVFKERNNSDSSNNTIINNSNNDNNISSNKDVHATTMASSFSRTFGFLGASGDATSVTPSSSEDICSFGSDINFGNSSKPSSSPILVPASSYPARSYSKSPLPPSCRSPLPAPPRSPLPSQTPQVCETDKIRLDYNLLEQPIYIAAFLVPGKAHIYHLHHRKTRADIDAPIPSTTPLSSNPDVFLFDYFFFLLLFI